MYAWSDSRRAPLRSFAWLTDAWSWPFCVSSTASVFDLKLPVTFSLSVWEACLKTVTSNELTLNSLSFTPIGSVMRTRWRSFATRQALPDTTRFSSVRNRVSCSSTGMAGAYSRVFMAAHKTSVIFPCFRS